MPRRRNLRGYAQPPSPWRQVTISTRLTCSSCGTSIDVPGKHKHPDPVPCVHCDGTMVKRRMNGEAFRKPSPMILVASPEVTRPNKPGLIDGFTPKAVAYKTYAEYLASDLWQHIRGAVRRRDEGCCRICHQSGSEVHHLSYGKAVMEGRKLEKLVLLCRPCHEKVSFSSSGKRLSVTASAKKYERLAKRTAVKAQKPKPDRKHWKRRRRWKKDRSKMVTRPAEQ